MAALALATRILKFLDAVPYVCGSYSSLCPSPTLMQVVAPIVVGGGNQSLASCCGCIVKRLKLSCVRWLYHKILHGGPHGCPALLTATSCSPVGCLSDGRKKHCAKARHGLHG